MYSVLHIRQNNTMLCPSVSGRIFIIRWLRQQLGHPIHPSFIGKILSRLDSFDKPFLLSFCFSIKNLEFLQPLPMDVHPSPTVLTRPFVVAAGPDYYLCPTAGPAGNHSQAFLHDAPSSCFCLRLYLRLKHEIGLSAWIRNGYRIFLKLVHAPQLWQSKNNIPP